MNPIYSLSPNNSHFAIIRRREWLKEWEKEEKEKGKETEVERGRREREAGRERRQWENCNCPFPGQNHLSGIDQWSHS